MSYAIVRLLAPAERKDIALAALSGLGMLGCEEADEPAGVRLTAYFGGGADLERVRAELAGAGLTPVECTGGLAEQDWNAAWRESVQPVRLIPTVWVSPTWRPPQLARGERWIRIEPKMAFGTGHHESTRLAAKGVVRAASMVPTGGSLLDIGTGSGVLCFLGALQGLSPCVGVEIDLDCRENLAENRRANQCGAAVEFVMGRIDSLGPTARFDLAAMNMVYNDSAPLLRQVAGLLHPRGRLVWSGILLDGRGEALEAAAGAGFVLLSEAREKEWWAGVWRKA